jgi:DNA-binding transcriptional regulator YdaS (Cro superfamily)
MHIEATPFEALKQSVEIVGSQSAYARLCGVSQTAVWKWLQSGKRLPAEHVLNVENETGVSRHLLRPDIYPLIEHSVSSPADVQAVEAGAPIVAFGRRAGMKRAAGA